MRDASLPPSLAINWIETHRNVIRTLSESMMPWPYRDLFESTIMWSAVDTYARTTDPREKFRQHYAEQRHPPVVFIPDTNGYLGLDLWFPDKSQLSLLAPKPIEIRGDCIVSYEVGYEQAKREPYMFDHFNDADTLPRHERRRRAALVEGHVRSFFEHVYPDYYRPASNAGQYERSADDDFQLVLPTVRLLMDVKSCSYEDDDGQKNSPVRRPKTNVVYLFADWKDDQTTELYGIGSGGWIKATGTMQGELTHMSYNKTFSIECLLVMLNMARIGLDYIQFERQLLPPI
ncbi:hypothetical protein KKE60_08960 [Patescibacteria group bacterium]|nr:hypothetical protein [Patescibacteria group bacterium]